MKTLNPPINPVSGGSSNLSPPNTFMNTIWRVKVTVKHPAESLRTPSEFVDWYEGERTEAEEQFAEDCHRYGLPSGLMAQWTLCDYESLAPIDSTKLPILPPLSERPELSELLAKLRQIDTNGWCIATDGSCDDLTTEEAIKSLQETISLIESGN